MKKVMVSLFGHNLKLGSRGVLSQKASLLRRLLITFSAVIFAFGILFISVLRTAYVRYDFGTPKDSDNSQERVLGDEDINIEYYLAYHGRVLPDSTLWPLKAARDQIWLLITTNKARKAELMLLFADKRLASSLVLFGKEKYELGFTTLSKAEKYLEESAKMEKDARAEGIDTSVLLQRLSLASLKHYEVIEEDLIPVAPEDAKPSLVQTQNYSKIVYSNVRDGMFEQGLTPPENPFDWD